VSLSHLTPLYACLFPSRCACCLLQAKKAAEAAAKPVTKKAALLDDSSEETDPTLYFENRVKVINAKKSKGLNPYPHKFNVTMSLPEYLEKYKDLEAGSRLEDVTVAVAGQHTRPRAVDTRKRQQQGSSWGKPPVMQQQQKGFQHEDCYAVGYVGSRSWSPGGSSELVRGCVHRRGVWWYVLACSGLRAQG
jgi:hypothetical protein